ncbi:Mo-dependent nitrogenase C-terminal domain-containing protein [Leptolyngbya sp. AN03gr2]|uniref:Mo-dependent nitrogenase C-terminal domain-containing protein n=1 Tax=unclassified Leptolyngbya TaxID=2650499 RepID=UPI003D321FA1
MLRLIAKPFSLIPAQCPLARTFYFRGRRITIPPLCQLNPFYCQIMRLRQWAIQQISR